MQYGDSQSWHLTIAAFEQVSHRMTSFDATCIGAISSIGRLIELDGRSGTELISTARVAFRRRNECFDIFALLCISAKQASQYGDSQQSSHRIIAAFEQVSHLMSASDSICIVGASSNSIVGRGEIGRSGAGSTDTRKEGCGVVGVDSKAETLEGEGIKIEKRGAGAR